MAPSTIRPPLALVNTATPPSYAASADAPLEIATAEGLGAEFEVTALEVADGHLVLEENELRVLLSAGLQANAGLGHAGVAVHLVIDDDQAFAVCTADNQTAFAYAGVDGVAGCVVEKPLNTRILFLDFENGTLNVQFHGIGQVGFEFRDCVRADGQGQH